MRWRVLALVSIGVNIVLAAAWLLSMHSASSLGGRGLAGGAQATNAAGKTNLIVRRQFFTWREIESPDYPTYIANLRDIGCPEQTIRDLIIADVNGLYARKRALELVTPDQQWWRSEPDTNVLQAAIEKARELEEERRGLLARLLGTNWEAGDMANLPRPSRPGLVLDGPILGGVSADTKLALQHISTRSQERLNAYLEARRTEGKEADPAELARLRQQTRNDLQQVLTPAQLEEFLLRYSQDANNLRETFGQLRFFNPTPDEFRAVFRATDVLEERIQLLAGTDANTVQARKALEDERENALKLALGPKRYEEYRQLQDPLYRDAVASAQQAGMPEAARAIYQINLAAAAEEASIRSNATLTAEQKDIELKRLALEQAQANAVATDQELPPEPAAAPPPAARRAYVVGPGDTAASIAIIYGIPVSALRNANPDLNLNKLKPGDSVQIPRNPLAPSAGP